jgi:hypothetical protein
LWREPEEKRGLLFSENNRKEIVWVLRKGVPVSTGIELFWKGRIERKFECEFDPRPATKLKYKWLQLLYL